MSVVEVGLLLAELECGCNSLGLGVGLMDKRTQHEYLHIEHSITSFDILELASKLITSGGTKTASTSVSITKRNGSGKILALCKHISTWHEDTA